MEKIVQRIKCLFGVHDYADASEYKGKPVGACWACHHLDIED